MQEMEYLHVDIPHFVINLFCFTVLITQNHNPLTIHSYYY
nr:MAG TPA: hypothetical protein [Caudoviricetes sp.]